MNPRNASAALALLCAITMPFEAAAMGFGRARVMAILGQSLEVTIPVRLETGEVVTPDCVNAEVYYGDSKQAATSVRTTWEPGNGNDHVVRVYSSVPVDEPVVSVYATVGCATRMTRKWVAFADPPANVAAESLVPAETAGGDRSADAPRTAASVAAPARTPRAAAAPGNAASQAARRPATASVVRRPAPVAAAPRPKPQPKLAQEDSVVRKPQPADLRTPVELTSRLRLDLIESEALIAPNLRLAGDLPTPAPEEGGERRAAAAALWKALNASPEELARDRERVAQLESTLKGARDDMTATRTSLSTLQSRLEVAESSRYSNPIVIVLAALVAALAAAVAWLWMQRKRDREAQAWWGGAGAGPQTAVDSAAVAAGASTQMPVSMPEVVEVNADDDEDRAGVSPPTMPLEAAPRRPAVAMASKVAGPEIAQVDDDGGAPRHMSVEELIDLEQQADFFQVLGQDEAAIDLLVGHVRHPGGTSPLPYLKLMEIYQRRGERGEYDQVRERFNAQFNAYAPGWEEELNQGRSLEDYPSVIGRLQTLWAMPARALEVLQASLLRQDANAATFDLPAYRELLFLYSLARDLAEVEEREGAVDLLLPVGDDDGEAQFTASSLSPLTPGTDARATGRAAVVDRVEEVEFDLDAPESKSGSIDFDIGDVDATVIKGGRNANPR